MYSTDRTPSGELSRLLNRVYQKIERTTHKDPHPGLIIATHHFKDPYPIVSEIDLLCHATMDLLIQFAYPSLSGYGKFTISYTMLRYGEEISFTIGAAIPLTYEDCNKIPTNDVYAHVYRCIQKYAEIYDRESLSRLMIRVYIDGKKMDRPVLSSEERESTKRLHDKCFYTILVSPHKLPFRVNTKITRRVGMIGQHPSSSIPA